MVIPASSYQEFDARDLLAGHLPQFEEGSLQVSHQGAKLQLGVQIKILKLDKGLIFDEQLVQTSRFVSSRLENVWWLPSSQPKTKFIISNTIDSPVTATVTVDGTAPKQQQPTTIELNPHQTRVLDILRDLVGKQQGGTIHKEGGISVSHSGTPGAVLARMSISKENTGFSSVANFIDPQATRSSKWNGSGYRIGKIGNDELTPIVVARNIGNESTNVSGRISYTNDAGEVVFVNVPSVRIGANKIKTIDVERAVRQSNVPANVSHTGFEFEYSTPNGSVVMAALSVSRNDNHVFQVPLFDPERMASSAGGYPWKADGDYTTMLYIKNETDQPQKYTAVLTYEGGNYAVGVKDIKPHQLVAIDFRALRDNQTPDAKGNTIPLNIEGGEIAWSSHGKTNKALSGRSHQSSISEGVSSTYDCRNCCPNSDIFTGDSVPGIFEAEPFDIQFFDALMETENCYGNVISTFPVDVSGWESSNVSIATIEGDGMATAQSPGEAYFSVPVISYRWRDVSGYGECGMEEVYNTANGSMEVRPGVVITPFEVVGKGSTFQVSIQVTNNNNNTPITLRLRKLSGTGEAQFMNNSSTTIIYQSGNVEIKGITDSSAKDNYIIETIINNRVQTSNQSKDNFSIAKIKISRTIGTQQPTEITDMTADTIVGERIKLNAEVVPSGISLANHLWTLPGKVMKNFKVTPNPIDPNQSSSQVVPVDSLNTSNVDYVWYDGADGREVNYKVNAGSSQISGKTIFNVKRPEASVISVSTNNSTTTIDSATGNLELHVGLDTPQTAGIRFSLTSITVPTPFTGDKQWVQTVNRTITATDINGSTGTVSNSGLDKCYPYTTVNANSAWDSPGFKLSQFTHVNLNYQFSMWYMFKPSGSDSSWVPLRKVNWRWLAEAQLTQFGIYSITLTRINQANLRTWIRQIFQFGRLLFFRLTLVSNFSLNIIL